MSSTPSVLIVEDDPVFRHVLAFTVTNSGLNVRTASNGLEAYQFLLAHDVDFLVIDHQMPICTGEQLLELLSSRDRYQRPPTVLCTAKAHEMDTQSLRARYGLLAVLCKPFSPRQLSDLMLDQLTETSRADRPDVLRGPIRTPRAGMNLNCVTETY